MVNGPDRNCNCRRLGGQNAHPFKRPIDFFAPDLTVIQESFKRKYVRGPEQRPVITEDVFYPTGQDYFTPTPSTTVIRIPLSGTADIYTGGLMTSGSALNLGTIQDDNGVEGGNSYRVDANDQGLFIRNPMRLMPLDEGEFSVYLNSHDASGSGTNNYILDVGQNMVLRWESGSQQLRLYPDITNYPSDYMGVSWTSLQWYSTGASWHKYKIRWSYQDQDWQLFIDDAEASRTGSSTIPHPGWNTFTVASIFADHNNENNVYHDCQYLSFGERHSVSSGSGSNPTLDDVYNNSPSGNKAIAVDDGPVTFDTGGTAWKLDADSAVAGDITLQDRVEWDEDIATADGNFSVTSTGLDIDVDYDASAIGVGTTVAHNYYFLNHRYDFTGSPAGGFAGLNYYGITLNFDYITNADATTTTAGGYFAKFLSAGADIFEVDYSGKVSITERIEHILDTDTNIIFTDDKITFNAGNINMLELIEAAQDIVVFNQGSADVDHRIESANIASMFFLDASVDTIGIDEATPDTDVILHLGGGSGQGIGFRNDHPPRCRMFKNADQIIATGTWTKVTFQNETYDTDSIGDLVNSRITPGVEGYYDMTSTLLCQNGGRWIIAIYKNGALIREDWDQVATTPGSRTITDKSVYSNSTDYFEIWVHQNSGGNLNIYNPSNKSWFTVHRAS